MRALCIFYRVRQSFDPRLYFTPSRAAHTRSHLRPAPTATRSWRPCRSRISRRGASRRAARSLPRRPHRCHHQGRHRRDVHRVRSIPAGADNIDDHTRALLGVDEHRPLHHRVDQGAHLLGGSLYDSVCAFKKGTGEDVHDTETRPVAKLPWRRMIGDWREPHDF